MLIKSAKSDRLMKEAIVLDMGDLARQADRILSNAQQEAGQVLQIAREESERLVASADDRGYSQGFERGLGEGRETGEAEGRKAAFEQASESLSQLARNWTAALDHWERQRREMLQDANEDIVRFAFALAQRVVLRMPQVDPAIVRDQVAAALETAARATTIEIVINPNERTLIEQSLPELLAAAGRFQHAVIREDAKMSVGGCIIRTAAGTVDATMETQLDRIAEALVPMAANRTDQTQGQAS
jgi:flagellar assembly protein FliH